MLTDFIRYLEAERRYSPLTVRNYRHDIELFLAWLGISDTDSDLRRVTTEDIREWIIFRNEEGRLSAASINREISSLRSLFRWLLRTGVVSRDVAAPVASLKTSRRLPAFVPESRMSGIVSDCEQDSDDFTRERNSLIVLLFYACGLRLAELVGIDRRDFSEDYTSLRIRGKGDKERRVYFDAKAKLHLQDYLRSRTDANPALFVTLDAPFDRLKISGVEIRLRELGRELNLDKIHPHKFRRTMATRAIDKGMPIEQVQKILGHSQIGTTMQYAIVNQNNVKTSHQKFIA